MLKKQLLRCLALTVFSLGMSQHSFAQQSSGPGLQQRLGGLFSVPKEDELLEPDQAFKLKVSIKGPTTVMAELTPADGYYMYRDKIHFSVENSSGVAIKTVKLPTGDIKMDKLFGRMETYKKPIQAEITLERAPNAKNTTLVAVYQGCHEKLGVCYPPIDKSVNLSLP